MKRLLVTAAALAAMSAAAFAVSPTNQHRPRGNSHDIDALTCPSGVETQAGSCIVSRTTGSAKQSYHAQVRPNSAFDTMTANQNSHNEMP